MLSGIDINEILRNYQGLFNYFFSIVFAIFVALFFSKRLPKWLKWLKSSSLVFSVILFIFVTISYIYPYLPIDPKWQNLKIETDKTSTTISWNDIFWLDLDQDKGFLVGSHYGGGGHGYIGSGVFMQTTDGGAKWTETPRTKFISGQGKFTWGPKGTRIYQWDNVGPIQSIQIYTSSLPRCEKWDGWMATYTGIYEKIEYKTPKDGCKTPNNDLWKRSSPPPDSRDRYAFFSNFVGIEGSAEIYAVGWQGISHWDPKNNWTLQMPTYTFNISSIGEYGGSENRQLWAVGRTGNDKNGKGDESGGGLYRLENQQKRWQIIPLNMQFKKGQGFNDLVISKDLIIAVGDIGLIVQGKREEKDDKWKFKKIGSSTNEQLNSVAVHNSVIYIVGNKGTILFSRNCGNSWQKSSDVAKDNHGFDISKYNLNRIRFFKGRKNWHGWILGDGIVLKSSRLSSASNTCLEN